MTPDLHDHPRIRPAAIDDAGAVASIYNHYVTETIVTFEEEVITEGEMQTRMQAVHSVSLPWLIAEHRDGILGYACASKWKSRSAYRFSTEVTVYLDHRRVRRGIGSLLYAHLLDALKAGGCHAAMGGIALPNDASVRLHEKLGFRQVALFKEVGFKFNRWIDVGYWQRML